MKNLFVILCVLLLVPAIGFGQEQKTVGQGYLYVAPSAAVTLGDSMSMLQFGGGGECNLFKGVGIEAEIGYLSPTKLMGFGVGVFSFNGLYSFKPDRRSKVAPYVTGRYSMMFRRGHLNSANFGAGVNYWLSEKTGLRFEFRDYVRPKHMGLHIIQGRIGVTFR